MGYRSKQKAQEAVWKGSLEPRSDSHNRRKLRQLKSKRHKFQRAENRRKYGA